ncbi:c-type cytochrome [bacterium]|nr:c-type cytochrome [bacterium]
MRSFTWIFSLLFVPCAWADFPKLFNSEPISDETLMPAELAAASMQLPAGLTAKAFAAEPDIQNPIAMSWDARGRLWVAENYTYAERKQRFQLDLRDRIVIFDNTHEDRFKTRTVFTDDVQMLTGMEVGLDGVWLMCPPKLIFIPDRNRDDIPDNPGEVVLDGFTVAQQNYHNFANGLQFGPDGWLYGRCGGSCPARIGVPGSPDGQRLALEGGMWRYHPIEKRVEVLTTGTTNPWGHDWNSLGEAFFVNTVNGHLWHLIPGAHFTRPFVLDPNRRVYELIDFHADHWHFDTGESWTKSRDGTANSFGGGHAHSGTMVYQADNWPEIYRDRLFTLNFHGRRANQEILERKGSGYVASHGKDMLLAKDPWFRGMELGSGPDGAVFVLDWSDAGECHEHTGVHRTSGRIFKVRNTKPLVSSGPTDLATWSLPRLVNTHVGRNDWQTRQARLELARRRMTSDITSSYPLLNALLDSPNSTPSTKVQALLTLHVIGGTTPAILRGLSNVEQESLRSWSIRLLTDTWPLDDAIGPAPSGKADRSRVQKQARELMQHLLAMANHDPSALVRLSLASTLQRLPIEFRPVLANALVQHAEDTADHNLPLMIWYGLIPVANQNPGDLLAVARDCKIPKTLELISRCIAEQVDAFPKVLDQLLKHAANRKGVYLQTVLEGVTRGLKGRIRAPRPKSWDLVTSIQAPEVANQVRELGVVFGDGRAIKELRKIARGKDQWEPAVRLAALQTVIQSDAEGMRKICEDLLSDQHMNLLAARGLSQFDEPEIGESLVERYRNFRSPVRPQVMSILVSRKSFAKAMLQAIEKNKIPASDLSAFQVSQIKSFSDPDLNELIGRVWGETRTTPQEMQISIDQLKKSLSGSVLAEAELGNGHRLFKKLCQNCHRLFGEGEKIGPDLTGSNRNDLDYLLSNMIDPSGIVAKDYRMTILLTTDNRLFNGLVTDETARTISIQTATERITFDKLKIQERKETEKSPMPDGLLDTLSATDIRDLVSYLQQPTKITVE